MGGPRPLVVIGPFTEPVGTDPGPEAVAVATELRWPGHHVPCPSAAVLAGALRRRGMTVMSVPMTVGGGPRDGAVVLHGVGAPAPQPDQPAAAVGYRPGRDHLSNEIRAVAGLWRRAAGPRTVLLASPRSFCAGVDRAIRVIEQVPAERGRPVYVRKQIVHNTHVVNALRDRGAVSAVAAEADLVLVVGSANSSNSVRLVELWRRQGVPAHLVEDAGHIDLGWLVNAATIGLTAGASAPAALVDDVIAALRGLGPVAVEVREVATETVQFALPRKVRRP